MKIPLTGKSGKGQYALVDDDDFERVSKHGWWLHKYGYPTTRIAGKNISLHRYVMNAQPGQYIDHKNLNRLDNHKDNLRFCSWRENLSNSAPRYGRKYKGVYFEKTGKPRCWHAKINHNGKQISFGRYLTEIEAARAYDGNIVDYKGEFAWLNFPTAK